MPVPKCVTLRSTARDIVAESASSATAMASFKRIGVSSCGMTSRIFAAPSSRCAKRESRLARVVGPWNLTRLDRDGNGTAAVAQSATRSKFGSHVEQGKHDSQRIMTARRRRVREVDLATIAGPTIAAELAGNIEGLG